MAVLDRYFAKRDFKATPEPRGRKHAASRRAGIGDFVVQKHAARRLHYDLRLELDGTLKSWAVTNGPSLVPGVKRLAVETEDHPLEYKSFEGTIPAGQYGAGRMIVWDNGRWTAEGDARRGLAKGHLRFALAGKKLAGRFDLVRMKPRRGEKRTNWLLIKVDDEYAREEGEPDILEEAPQSVKSGREIDDLDPPDGAPAARKPAATAKRSRRSKAKAGLPGFIEPELARPSHHVPSGKAWLHEIKFDGYRLQLHVDGSKARLYTRSGLDWTHKFSGLAEAAGALEAANAIIDGEVVVEGSDGRSSFAELQAALSAGEQSGMALYAFDLLFLDGEDLRPLPLEARKERLAALIGEGAPGVIRLSEHFESGGEVLRRHACKLGLEGIVSKKRDAPYRSGRSGNWQKIKCANRQEFVVVGFVPSTVMKRAIGALALALPDKDGYRYVGKVGTGYTAASAHDLFKALDKLQVKAASATVPKDADARGVKWVEPQLVAEIEYRAITASGQLRHAAFLGLRADKEAGEVTDEPESAPTAAPREESSVTLTHPDRLYWPKDGVTKRGLVDYYTEIWPRIAGHVTHRPLALVRCPDGIEGGCFFQKAPWRGVHKSVHSRTDEDDHEIIFIEDLDGLIALIQAGALEIHPWGSREDDIERPDRLIFDLDPGDGVPWSETVRAAREVRERLRSEGLETFVKTTGGKGLHVIAPLVPSVDWDAAKAFCKDIAETMQREAPDRFIAKATKSARKGLIFVDYLRNGRGATAVAPYSTRARPGATVAAPLAWDELDELPVPNPFNVGNLLARLDAIERDPWEDFFAVKQRLDVKAKPRGRKPRKS